MAIETSLSFLGDCVCIEGLGRYGPFRCQIERQGVAVDFVDWDSGLERHVTFPPREIHWHWEFPYRPVWASFLSSLLWDVLAPITGNPWDPNTRRLMVTVPRDVVNFGVREESATKLIQLGRPTNVPLWRRDALAAKCWLNEMSKLDWDVMLEEQAFDEYRKSLRSFFPKEKKALKVLHSWYQARA